MSLNLIPLLILLSPLFANQPGGGPNVLRESREANAALKYLRAYAAFRQAKAMPPNAASLIEKYSTASLDVPAAELVAAAEDALRELHHGAALRHCDWAVSSEDGPAADTSHRGVARELIAVAGLRARLRFRDGQAAEAAGDLLAAITLARHLSLDGSLASPLIAHALEQEPANLLAHHLPQLGEVELRRVAARLEALPPGASLADALLSHEKISRGTLTRSVRAARGRGDLITRLTALPMLGSGAADFLDSCGGTADGIVRRVEELRSRYAGWARRFALPPEQFEKEYAAEATELAKKNPVFRLLTPSVARIRWTAAYRQTQRALLRAAIAAQQSGAEVLNRYPDPYDGQRFEYLRTEGGFRLQSRLKQNGKPLVISIGLIE
jgi:hypothetical protein